jgi:hypothetical protein
MALDHTTWGELFRDWLLRAIGQQRLSFLLDQVGGGWTKEALVV